MESVEGSVWSATCSAPLMVFYTSGEDFTRAGVVVVRDVHESWGPLHARDAARSLARRVGLTPVFGASSAGRNPSPGRAGEVCRRPRPRR